MSRLTELQMPLLVKLGSIVVHADEFTSPDGHEVDRATIRSLLTDPDVQKWITDMGALLPLKRSTR